MKMKIFAASLCCILEIVSSEPCFAPKELNLFALGASCGGTPSLRGLPCQHALDYDNSTIWMPNDQYRQYYVLSLNRKTRITSVAILQNKWSHGHAKRIRLTLGEVGSFKYKLRSTPWVNLNLPYSITTKNIEIRVIGVENILFGGFKEIKLFGCGPTLDDWNSVVTGRPSYQNPGGGGLNRQPSEPIILPDEENVAWIETPSAIGFICGITFGVLVCIVFLVINIYVCCTKDSSKSSKTLSVIQSTNTGSTLGSVRRSNLDLEDNISIKSEASNRPGSRLSSKSGSVILVHKVGDEDRIEVIEEVDEDMIEMSNSSIQDII